MSRSAVEAQIDVFLGRYSAPIEAQLREARALLRAKFTHGFELVYDNYNALVFGISPTERTSEVFLSVAGYPKWVTLFFLHGTWLHDPRGLLEGAGKRIRSIRLKAASDMDAPTVLALVQQATSHQDLELAQAPALSTIIKSISAKQRPRRSAD